MLLSSEWPVNLVGENPFLDAEGTLMIGNRHWFFSSLCAASLLAIHARADGDFRTIAVTGQTAPGAGAGVTFADFEPPVVNQFGEAAFLATLSSYETVDLGGGFTYDEFDTGVWSEGGGAGLGLMAKKRVRPPGTASGVRYASFGNLSLNDAGAVACFAVLDGPAVNQFELDDYGVWSNRNGQMTLVARGGQHAPGFPSGIDFAFVLAPQLNNAGQMAYSGYPLLNGTATTSIGALYSDVGGGGLELIARTTDPAPGLPGVNYGIVGGYDVSLSQADEIGFVTTLEGAATGSALWTKKGAGPVSLAIRTGVAASDLPGLEFTSFDCCIEFGGTENVVFGGQLDGTGVDDDNNEALFHVGVSGAVSLLAREGDQAWGLPSGVVFGRYGDLGPSLRAFRATKANSNGDILLRGGLRGPNVDDSNNSAIWIGNAEDGFELIARAGDPVSGAPLSSVFNRIDDSALNEAGQAAFFGATNWNKTTAVWATDRQGTLKMLAQLGQEIDVDDGPGVDLRTIQSFMVTSELTNHDREILSIGEQGHVAFRVQFTDDTQALLVSNLVAVPEPASALLLALGIFAGNRTRFRVCSVSGA